MRPVLLLPLSVAVVTVLLMACSPSAAPPTAGAKGADLAALRPADPGLAERYERSCQLCHTQRASGAPLVGDAAAWGARAVRGDAALLASVVNGLGAMPPRGLCPDCSNTDLQRLVTFLQKPQQAETP